MICPGADDASYDGYTVFAPTDSAFLALPEGTFRNLVQPENQALLMKVLSYHILPSEVKSSEIQSGSTSSIAGDSLTLQTNGQSVTVNGAQVTQPDIQASDGGIHVVDRVILPPDVQAGLNSAPASTSSLSQR